MTTPADFELFLTSVCDRLTQQVRADATLRQPNAFQAAVGIALEELSAGTLFKVDGKDHPYVFPDFALGAYGVEVKYTQSDSWRSVANSVFEGQRSEAVKHIYIVFGKLGGLPEVRFARYEDCVMHVRTSHVPRFEVDLATEQSLFDILGITYEDFQQLDEHAKMEHIRRYARSRLKKGERLWWLDEGPEPTHTLPIGVRLYTALDTPEKRQLRAEAALLSPGIVRPSRQRGKYTDAVMYLMTYHGVLCYQARDLFSAGSVALRADGTRGGNYLLRALKDIEGEMRTAAVELPMELFEEYWEESPLPHERIPRWLEKADRLAVDWTPSKELFRSP
jgi:hypothetical protein